MLTYSKFFTKSVEDIPFLYFLYLVSTPLAIIFIKLKFKPNSITTLSNISAIFSFIIILMYDSFLWFYFFWLLALFLDICDGIVSRSTNQKSPQGSFYDHYTDQIKIVFLFFTAGIYYNTTSIWILTFITSTSFLLYSLLSYMIRFRQKILILNLNEYNTKKFKSSNSLFTLFKRYTYNNIFIMQGNLIVFLGLIFISPISLYMFYLIILIILFNLIKSLKYMNDINKSLQQHNLKWN